MIDARARHILLEEIDSWHREELITDDQHAILRRRYLALPETDEAVAVARETRTSTTLIVFQSLGGGLIVLGLLFLIGTYWDDLGGIGQQVLCWGLTLAAYGVAHMLFASRRYPRSTVAVGAIANCVLPVAWLVTFDYFSTGHSEFMVLLTSLITPVYLVLAVRTRSRFLSLFFAVGLVMFDLSVAFEWLELDDIEGMWFCIFSGALITLAGYLISSTPVRYMTAALGLAGLGMVQVSSFIGTFYSNWSSTPGSGTVYVTSYVLMFLVPLAISVFGARKGIMPLVYVGVITLWGALIRLFSDVLEDATGVMIASIVMGILIVFGAVRFEKRRAAAERPPVHVPD